MTSAYNRYEYCVDDFEEYEEHEEHFHSEYDYDTNIRPLIGRLRMGIDRLPPDLREVFCLRFFSNMKYDAIGHIVGCPPGTVRSRLSRARNQIRNHLENLEKVS